MYKRLYLTLYEGKRLLFIFVFSLFCFSEIPKKNSIMNSFLCTFLFINNKTLLTTKLFCLRLFSFSDAVWSHFFNRRQDGLLLFGDIFWAPLVVFICNSKYSTSVKKMLRDCPQISLLLWNKFKRIH